MKAKNILSENILDTWIINKNVRQKIDENKYRKKNTLFGFKFKFLGRTPSGTYLSEEQAIKRCATIVYQAFYIRGLIVKNVFFKPQTLDFFVATEKDLISLNSLEKSWVNEYKNNWGKVFFNATVGQYTLYEDQYKNITNKIGDLVMDLENKCTEPEDIWFKEKV